MRILVFLHGTLTMHPAAAGKSRAERVQQVLANGPSLHEFATYIPVDGAVGKLEAWAAQGAELVYLSSRAGRHRLSADRQVLERYRFPPGELTCREDDEGYGDVVARVRPDVLIEDDCESIGGWTRTCIAQTRPEVARQIVSILVPEFGGIDHLPDDLSVLLSAGTRQATRRR